MKKGGSGMYLLLGHRGTDGKAEAWDLLRRALGEAFGLEELPAVERLARGKPWFPGRPDLRFNLSHSGPFSLCAVGEGEVGVDIEVVRPRSPGLARRALSDGEYRWYEARGGRLEDFYTLWTRKESLAKYTGEGIADVRHIVPPLPGEEPSGGPALRSWAGEGWRAALCGEGPLPEEIRWV